jgi:hypothetical protein
MADAGTDEKFRVFVSYSRKDEDFAEELVAGLQASGFQPYLDKRDIAAGEDWEARLGRLIESADTVVFVISADSVASERCAWEIERTANLKKRLLPVVWRSVEDTKVPQALKQLNYIFFDKPHSFGPSLASLSNALRTDLNWIRENTRLGEVALRWQLRRRVDALLLRGEELQAAKEWLTSQPQFAPEPTLLVHEFIKASEDAESERENATRRALEERARLLRRGQRALAIIALLVLVGGGAVLWQYRGNLALQASLDKSGRELLTKQRQLQHQQANLLGQVANVELLRGNIGSSLRFAAQGTRIDLTLPVGTVTRASAQLAATIEHADWRLMLRGHEGSLFSAAFSPDGTRIITASDDKTARVWDAGTGSEIKVLRGHEGSVQCAAFSPDGTRIVTASMDKSVRIWDAATGNEIKVLRGHEYAVYSAAFSPDGTRIVTASFDGTAWIWDAATSPQRHRSRCDQSAARIRAPPALPRGCPRSPCPCVNKR